MKDVHLSLSVIKLIEFKTLTIKKKVYEELLRIKRNGESFSELFERMMRKKRPDILKFAGAWSKMFDRDFKKIIVGMRMLRDSADKSFEERMRRTFK